MRTLLSLALLAFVVCGSEDLTSCNPDTCNQDTSSERKRGHGLLQTRSASKKGAVGNRAAAGDVCAGDSFMSLTNLAENNLGGQGPKKGADERMLFTDVFANGEKRVDLEIRAVGPYNPRKSKKNGLWLGSFGNINLKSGERVALEFSFLESGTNTPVTVPPFVMSFLDLDHNKEGGYEMVAVYPFLGYSLTEDTTIDVLHATEDSATFVATEFGNFADNPTHPLSLTPFQMSRSVSVSFGSISHFTVVLEVSEGGSGRNFFFSGPSNIVCPPTPTCESFECPVDTVLAEEPGSIECETGTCSADICCKDKQIAMCDGQEKFSLDQSEVLLNNLHGADANEEAALIFGNVFPNRQDKVNLVITPESGYKATFPRRNGLKRDGPIGVINLRVKSTTRFSFKLVDASTGEPAALGPFYFSFLDLDMGVQGAAIESLTLEGATTYTVAELSELLVETSHAGIEVEATGLGTGDTNPTDPFSLDKTSQSRAITFSFPAGVSEFSVEMGVTKGFGGRNFLFCGPTDLVC